MREEGYSPSTYVWETRPEIGRLGAFVALSFVFVASSGSLFEATFTGTAVVFATLAALGALASPNLIHSGGRSRLAFLLLAGLEHPTLLQSAMAISLFLSGLYWGWPRPTLLLAPLIGALLALCWNRATHRLTGSRRWLGFALGWSLLGWAGYVLWPELVRRGWIAESAPASARAIALLSASLLYFLFSMVSPSEQKEEDIALVSLGLGASLAMFELPLFLRGAVVLLPVGLFVLYSERILHRLQSFIHLVRALGDENAKNWLSALAHYRRAIDLAPASEGAIEGFWRTHSRLTAADWDNPALTPLIDPDVCYARMKALVDRGRPEDDEQLRALHALVARRRPEMASRLAWQRVRYSLSLDQIDDALRQATESISISPSSAADRDELELEALASLWTLLLTDRRLVARGAPALLDEPSRLFSMEVVFRRFANKTGLTDPMAALWGAVRQRIDREWYERYVRDHPDDSMAWFDYRWALDEAAALEASGDSKRALDLLFIAEHGLPECRLACWRAVTRILRKQRSPDAHAWGARLRDFALERGLDSLSESERDAFFETVRWLAEDALLKQDDPSAIEHLTYFSKSPKSGTSTLRRLKELHERAGDPLSAIKAVESALAHQLDAESRAEWLREKKRLYESVPIETLRSTAREASSFFDFAFCAKEAEKRLDEGNDAAALAMIDRAAVGGGDILASVNHCLGRIHFRGGRFQDAAACWEQVIQRRSPLSKNDALAMSTCRLLGDLCLDQLGQPKRATELFMVYKDHVKSGADTLFKLGRGYEAMGEWASARKWYDMVLVYPSHPLAESARAALRRLGAPPS